MKKILPLAALLVTVLAACKKEALSPTAAPQPAIEMVYTNLNNREVKYQLSGITVDVNKDNQPDLLFGWQLVGDPVYAVDKLQFFVLSNIYTALPVNGYDQVMPLNKGNRIPLNDYNGNNWYPASQVILMERNHFANGAINWRGNWLNTDKKYLPFQALQNNQRYNGWVEVTADKNGERLVLHRMALSKEAEKEVTAGL